MLSPGRFFIRFLNGKVSLFYCLCYSEYSSKNASYYNRSDEISCDKLSKPDFKYIVKIRKIQKTGSAEPLAPMKLIATISDHIQAQKKGTMNENIHQSLLVDSSIQKSNNFALDFSNFFTITGLNFNPQNSSE